MEHAAEELIRAALHDLANTLSGIQGILDLADPARPLSTRDRDRLGAVLSEGQTTLARARSLAMAQLPAAGRERGDDWAAQLQAQLAPLCLLFRSRVDLACTAPELPGPRLRALVHALARLLLPYAAETGLRVVAAAEGERWTLTFSPAAVLPEALDPAASVPRDIASRWALALAEGLQAQVSHGDGRLRLQGPL